MIMSCTKMVHTTSPIFTQEHKTSFAIEAKKLFATLLLEYC